MRPLGTLLGCMFVIAMIAGLFGYLTAKAQIFYLVEPLASEIPVVKHTAFLTAGWAHSSSYLSDFIGGIILWIKTWRRRSITLHNHYNTAPAGRVNQSEDSTA